MHIPNKLVDGIWWTPRELQVMHLIAEAKCNKEIAADLRISESTVKCWIGRIIRKLHLDDGVPGSIKRVRIARWAIANGIA